MNLDERLSNAAHRLADGLTPPEVDLDAVRHQARVNQRRTVALVATGAVVAVVVATTVVGIGRESTAPVEPVGPRRANGGARLPGRRRVRVCAVRRAARRRGEPPPPAWASGSTPSPTGGAAGRSLLA